VKRPSTRRVVGQGCFDDPPRVHRAEPPRKESIVTNTEAAAPARGTRHPLRRRDFLLLLLGTGVSRLGSNCLLVAMPLLLLSTTGSALRAGLVEATWGLVYLVTCLPAGSIVDRLSRRTAMVMANLGCASGSVLLVASIVGGFVTLPLVLVVVTVFAVAGPLYEPAASASIRRIVPADQLPAALSAGQVRNQVAQLVGPMLGGALFTVWPAAPFLLDGVSYLVAALAVLLVRTPLGLSIVDPGKTGLLRHMLAGVRFLARSPMLRYSVIAAAVASFCVTGVLLTVIFALARPPHHGAGAGLVISVATIGSLAGALTANRVIERLSMRQILIAVSVVYAVAVTAMALLPNGVVYAGALTVCMFVTPAWTILFSTYQLRYTPDELQGRVQSAVVFATLIITPLGQLAAGALFDQYAASATFAVFAVGLAVLAITNLASPALRRLAAAAEAAAPVS
jgi:MFS family permease